MELCVCISTGAHDNCVYRGHIQNIYENYDGKLIRGGGYGEFLISIGELYRHTYWEFMLIKVKVKTNIYSPDIPDSSPLADFT